MSLVSRIPKPVLRSVPATGAATFSLSDIRYDYAVGGLPFVSAASVQNPIARETAPSQNPRQNNSTEPGEQSLGFWWLKSQSSFHGGSSQLYIDTPVPQGNDIRPIRYNTSAGLNPWVQGKVSMLHTTTKVATVGSTSILRAVSDNAGNNYLLYSDGSNLYRITETVSGGTPTYSSPTTVSWGGTGNIVALAYDGQYYYASSPTSIYRGDITTPGVAATAIYNFGFTASNIVLDWSKVRLMAGVTGGGKSALYELDNIGTAVALPATPIFSHPNPNFIWTSFAEGPGAVYAGGYGGSVSLIMKLSLSSAGAVPTLSSATTAVELPPGEQVLGMFGYLSTDLGIVTNRGLRVGTFSSTTTGDFQYGPITVPAGALQGGGCTGNDRFLFSSYTDANGVAGVARSDLSEQLSIRPFSYVPDQRFAWCPDLRATDNLESFVAGKVTDVQQIAGRIAFNVPGSGIFVEHPSKLTPTASITTSRIRYETLDPKLVRYVRVRTEGGGGSLSVAVNGNSDAGGASVVTLNPAVSQDTGDCAVSLAPITYVSITVSFVRGADVTTGPTLVGYQLKALPAQKRQRFMQVSLNCYDNETDSSGQRFGYEGSAMQRLSALETLEGLGDVVNFQTLGSYPESVSSVLCVIEKTSFLQTSEPTDRQGFGGIITLTIRTVA